MNSHVSCSKKYGFLWTACSYKASLLTPIHPVCVHNKYLYTRKKAHCGLYQTTIVGRCKPWHCVSCNWDTRASLLHTCISEFWNIVWCVLTTHSANQSWEWAHFFLKKTIFLNYQYYGVWSSHSSYWCFPSDSLMTISGTQFFIGLCGLVSKTKLFSGLQWGELNVMRRK